MAAPTKRQLASYHVRRLRTMRNKLLNMAAEWDELDQFAVNRLTELADQAESVSLDLLEDAECVGEVL